MITVQVTLMAAPMEGVAPALAAAVITWARLRVEPRIVLRAILGFAVLGAVIVASHVIFAAPAQGAGPHAAIRGAALAGRLIAVAAAGVIFTAALGSDAIGRALSWYLRPVLGKAAARLDLMTRLAFRAVTLIGRDARACRDSLSARGMRLRRRPRRFVALLGSNTVVRALRRAETQAMAISSRGYRDRLPPWRTPASRRSAPASGIPTSSLPSWLWAGATVGMCLIGWSLPTVLSG